LAGRDHASNDPMEPMLAEQERLLETLMEESIL